MYLLDVCGHGIGAALLSISVINDLRSESLNQVDFRNPGQVLAELNQVFKMDPDNKSAEMGLVEIGDQFAILAEKAWKKFEISKARYLVNQGLEIVPEHERLLKLKKEFSRSKPALIFKSIDKSIKDAFK